MDYNYLAENNLGKLSPELHGRYIDCVGVADTLLGRYLSNFPEFTDHSLLHSMEVTNIANHLISNYISKLCAEELYILLMAALLHDVGMGYDPIELEKRCPLGYAEFRNTHDSGEAINFIRMHHHDLSAMLVLENWQECKIPNEAMAAAIAEVGRGHRKTDLMDRTLYPTAMKLGSSTVNMAYLAAVIRLADELDISASRNLMLQYVGFVPTTHIDAQNFQNHRSLQSIISADSIILKAETNSRIEYQHLIDLHGKVEETLTYCQSVVKSCAEVNLPIQHIVNEIRFIGKDIPLMINTEYSGDTITLALIGRIDTITAPLLDEKLATCFGGTMKNLILDCGSLDYVSSSGLRIFLSAKKKSIALQGEMTVQNVSDEVMAIFKMTGFASILGIYNGSA